MTEHEFFATTPRNLEPLAADELRALGAHSVSETRGGARFQGNLATAYRACLWSRVANRILLVLDRFPAPDADALYEGVRRITWHEHFDVQATFAVAFNSSQSTVSHSHFGAQKVKDAIVDQFRERFESRPNVDTERPDITVDIYLYRDSATVSLDLSGESLHRRGYRARGAAAPLKENLAAAILLRASWPETARSGGALIDPMCGSGTLPIEAALIAADIAPGLLRDHWGFLGWRQHDAGAWSALLTEARERRAAGLGRLPEIRGYDHHGPTVADAVANVERAGLTGNVHIEKRPMEECRPSRGTPAGLLVVNPPYGQRIGERSELAGLYTALGAIMRERFQGWRAAVITDDAELGKRLGMRAKRIHTVYNGAIECKLLHFDIEPAQFFAERPGPRPLPAAIRGPGAEMLANRLTKNLRHLRNWRKRNRIHCYRLYDADLPEYALAVDVYEGERRWVHVQEYQAPASVDADKARRRLREALGAIIDILEIPEEQLFFKIRRRQKGQAQYERLAETRRFHEVQEDDCRFLVNFTDYLDTGLFLDHRDIRALLAQLAGGRRFLNLFAYTGTASVYAAKGGARSTTTVDMSNTYLEWARRNMELNGFTGPDHRFIQADCLEWLDTADRDGGYDLIFLDPPSFSTSKRMRSTLDIQRDHATLIRATARLMDADGTLIFSNNLRRFRIDRDALKDFAVEDITRATLPKDFERDARIHNCWKITRATS